MNGRFDFSRGGSYIIEGTDAEPKYEYNLYNGDILVKLDKGGIDTIQINPPSGIFVTRRDACDHLYSKWICFFYVEGKLYSNFCNLSYAEKPEFYKIHYFPEKAVYEVGYKDFTVETEFVVPVSGCQVVCTVKISNNADREIHFFLTPSFWPLLVSARAAAWDRPDWYMRTACGLRDGENAVFLTRLMSAAGNPNERRALSLECKGDGVDSMECLLERFTGNGDFFHPDALHNEHLFYACCGNAIGMPDAEKGICGYQPVYSVRYRCKIKPGKSKIYFQVLRFADKVETVLSPSLLLNASELRKEISSVKTKYEELFKKNSVNTGDKEFDYYINSFLPLQLEWVIGLDRGWPTAMRGTRDTSNDFMGLLVYGGEMRAKKELLHLFSCQRSDGWFPRQCGKNSSGPHDLRNYCDGGVFVLEFLYEYLSFSKDFSVLYEKCAFSDIAEENSVFNHAKLALLYYLDEANTGDYGLCKIWEGDWFDGVNRAGILGKGVSVTVSCQFVMAAVYFREICLNLPKDFQTIADNEELSEILRALEMRTGKIRESLRTHAFNKEGFFSSVKNDAGKWIFSDCDPDGKSRMYAVANAHAIFTGAAESSQRISAYRNFTRLKTKNGYKLFSPPFDKPVEHVGRVASGDVIPGLWGNGSIYNHGSHGWLCRASAAMGDAEKLREVLNYLFPFNKDIHPESETKSARYAIVNCYQDSEMFRHRAGMVFLTGTTAMAARIVYTWMFGIRPTLSGLGIRPCLVPGKYFVKYTYREKVLSLRYTADKNISNIEVYVDGKRSKEKYTDVLTGGEYPFIPESKIINNMDIIIKIPDKKVN